jgi:hypothetical protein
MTQKMSDYLPEVLDSMREITAEIYGNHKLMRHPNSERFHTILKELGDLHDKKGADYGRGDDPFANVRASSEWGMPAWVGAMVRATDKLRRLQTFAVKGSLSNEGVEDSLRDLAVYSIIALVLFEETNKAVGSVVEQAR